MGGGKTVKLLREPKEDLNMWVDMLCNWKKIFSILKMLILFHIIFNCNFNYNLNEIFSLSLHMQNTPEYLVNKRVKNTAQQNKMSEASGT